MSSEKAERKRKFLLLSILTRINSGETPYFIAKKDGWTRQRLTYWVMMLKKAYLIRLKIRDRIAIYELTELGKKYYTESMNHLPSSTLELHNAAWIYELEKEGTGFSPEISSKGIKTLRFRNVTVQWSQTHIWFDVVKLFGNDAWQLYNDAGNLVEKVAEQLRSIGFSFENKRQMRKPHFGVIDPLITKVAKSMELRTTDAKVDESEGYGELEYFEPEKVNNYIKMPERIENLEKMVGMFTKSLEIYNKNIELHLATIQDIRDYIKDLRDTLKK